MGNIRIKKLLFIILTLMPILGVAQYEEDNSNETKSETILYIEKEVQKYAAQKISYYGTQTISYNDDVLIVTWNCDTLESVTYWIDLKHVDYFSVDISTFLIRSFSRGNCIKYKITGKGCNLVPEPLTANYLIEIPLNNLSYTMQDNLNRAFTHLLHIEQIESQTTEDKFH